MVEKPMKTLTAGEVKYIITDAEAREDIGELKSNLQYSISQTNLPTAATAYPFNFIAGHKYRLTVVGSGVTSFYRFFTTNNGLSTGEVDNFGSFKDGEKTVELEATANATHIRKGSYPEGSVSFTLTDLSSIGERLTKAEEDIEEIKSDVTEITGDVTDLKSQVINITDKENIPVQNGKYYKTDSSVNVNSPFVHQNWACGFIACTEGDVITITAQGSAQNNPWAYISDSGVVLTHGTGNVYYFEYKTIAPANAAYFIFNRYLVKEGTAYKGNNTLDVAKNDALVTAQKNKLVGLPVFEQGSVRSTGLNDTRASTTRLRSNYISVSANTKYTLYTMASGIRIYVHFYAVADYETSSVSSVGWITKLEFTTPENCAYIRIVVEHTPTATTIYPDEINPCGMYYLASTEDVADYGTASYNIITGNPIHNGTNIFDKNRITTGQTMNASGIISPYATWCVSDYIPFNPSGTYEIYNFGKKSKKVSNVYLCEYDINKTYLAGVNIRENGSGAIINSLEAYAWNDKTAYIRISFETGYSNSVMLTSITNGVPTIYRDADYNKYNRQKINARRDGAVISYSKAGYNTLDKVNKYPIYPHSSIPSFLAAMETGFDALWLDVLFTSDGYPVLSHNNNIQTIAVNEDGTAIANEYNITEHTLAELQVFDYGLMYGSMYAGTKLLSFEDGVAFAKKYGVDFVWEIESGESSARHEELAEIVKAYGMSNHCGILTYNVNTYLAETLALLPNADVFLVANPSGIPAQITALNAIASTHKKIIIAQFSNTIAQEDIDAMIDAGIELAFSNPASEPDGITSLFETERYMYTTRIMSRVFPAQNALRDSTVLSQ